MMFDRRQMLGGAAALGLTSQSQQVRAQDYPNRAVNLIVAAPAGGNTDVGARIVASIAEKELGQPIVVLNKAGAGGQVGWTELARSKPDGYTIGFIIMPGTNTVIIDPNRKAIFKEDAFAFIVNHVFDAGAIWVRADSPYKTLKDLIDAAKDKPNTIRAATTGILGDDHLAILMTEEASPGSQFRIVHLEGSINQLKEALGGNIDVAFDNVGGVLKPLKSGQIRALAVTDTERSKFLPDVPCTAELGYPTIVSSSTRGIAAPKGTPQPIIDRLAAVFVKAMSDPEHGRRMDEQGLAIKPLVGQDFAKFWSDIHARAIKYVEWSQKRG
jgi:tripartite-type tricarboxylate transporter receptor subunit TctC